MKYLHLHNVKIHRNIYQDWFINEYARKEKLKSQSPESRSFQVRHRRTYVLNKYFTLGFGLVNSSNTSFMLYGIPQNSKSYFFFSDFKPPKKS